MAKRTTKPPAEPPRPPGLTMSRTEADAKIAARLDKAPPIRARLEAGEAAAQQEYEGWNRYNAEMLARMFTDRSVADSYEYAGPAPVITMGGGPRSRGMPGWGDETQTRRLLEQFNAKVARLTQIRQQLELFEEPASLAAPAAALPAAAPKEQRRAAFVVHGHDEGAREATARVLEALKIEAVILHEQANQGRTILEKIEANADVPFAVVLLTPDDVGGKSPSDLKPRARQNVVLEMGFFWGKLSRARVCVLYKEGVELPSDLGGLVYVKMGDDRGWRFKLAEELEAAGIPVDFNLLRGS